MIDDVVDKIIGSFFAVMLGFISLLAILVVFAFAYEATGIPCSKHAAIKRYPYDYTFTTGCMLNVNGTWVSNSDLVPVDRGDKIVYLPKYKTRTELELK